MPLLLSPLITAIIDQLAKDHSLFVTTWRWGEYGGAGSALPSFVMSTRHQCKVLPGRSADGIFMQGSSKNMYAELGMDSVGS